MESQAFRDKLLSLGFRARTPAPKVTEERDYDGSGYTLTEHDDVQDVNVTPKTLDVKVTVNEE